MMMTYCPRCRRTFDDGVRYCPVDGVMVSAAGAPEDRNLGRVLSNQFEILDVCGRGAMGTVYRAHQRTMDRIVAVKILRRELLQEPDVVRRFVREARAAAKLQHPNIVTVHMVGETDDHLPFLVMEYVDGVSLEALVDGGETLGLGRSVRIAKQITSALADAHEAGIVHRDLKPANILVFERGTKTDRIKVLDFGIAKIVTPDGGSESLITRDGMIFGTPHYIAPEQATGNPLDARADLYSLGVILFRLTTGRLPFEGTAGMQVVLRHLREPPPQPRAINPTIPPPLEALILKCLAKDRADRPANADAVLGELDWIEEALPPDAATGPAAASSTAKLRALEAANAPSTPPAAPRPPVSWRRWAAIGGAAAAIAIGANAGILGARAHRVAPPAPVVAAAPIVPPPPASPLVDEHVLAEEGVTVRAGFVSAAANQLAVVAANALSVDIGADGKSVAATRSPGDGRWLAPLPAGAHKLRVQVAVAGRAAPLVLAFDVAPPAPAVAPPATRKPVAARPEPRRARANEELPVTIVPAEPKPPRVVAAPKPVAAPPAMAPAPAAPPAAPPAQPADPYPTTTVVVDHPKPLNPPRPAPTAPKPPPPEEEPPADEPPPAAAPSRPNDPTTLPPPTSP